MVCVLLPLDLTAHLFLSKGGYKEIWELEQTRELIIKGSLKSVMSICRQGLLAVPYVRSVSDDSGVVALKAKIGISWRSSGEDMQVKLEMLSEDEWKAVCLSRSTSANVLFDYAKNFENVETWAKVVRSKSFN